MTGDHGPGTDLAAGWSLVTGHRPLARWCRASVCRRSRVRAFTLIELLVAAALTAALAVFIAVIIRNVGTTWTRASGRLGADAQARIIMDQLTVDLQGAMFRDDGNVWMAADLENVTTNSGLWDNTNANTARIKPSGGLSLDVPATRTDLLVKGNLADARFGQAGVWLQFFTTRRGGNTTTATESAPVAVGYQIIRRPVATNAQNPNVARAYLLHRAEVRPTADSTGRPGVLESGYNITANAYRGTAASTTNSGAVTGDPRSIRVPGSNTTSPRNLDAVIGDDVIDFGVRCYVRDATVPGGLRLIFPVNASGALSNSPQTLRSTLPANTPPTAPNYSLRSLFPDVIDVMVRVLTDDGAALIANIEKTQTPQLTVPLKYNGNAQQWWWGVAQENSRAYTRRIVLNVKPL